MARPTAASTRLDAPAGVLIDRSRPIGLQFDGQAIEAFEGDTIASALAANGRWLLSRSFKYHRPRGPMSFAGHEANTLVQVGAEPNVAADLRAVHDGDDVQVVKRWTQTQAEALEELETLSQDPKWLTTVTAHLPAAR